MNQDLTVGKPEIVLWKFCTPLFGSILFQQLYNIADSFVAGKFIGEEALAAVGNSYGITMIFLAFAFGCNIGCSVIVSQLFGAKNFKDMKTAVSTAMIASGILCAVLMLAGTISCSSLLHQIRTPDEIIGDSKLYLDIYIWGLPFLFFYNIATGIFSALGDSKTPFLFLAASSTANILVDILFVSCLDMGVGGVAWATFLCQGVSCVLSVWVVCRRLSKIHTEGKAAVFSEYVLCFFFCSVWENCGDCGSEHFTAEFYIGREYHHPGGDQRVRFGCNRGLFCGCQAEQPCRHILYDAWKRHVQLYGAECRRRTARVRLPARIKAGFLAGIKMVWILCLPIAALYYFASDGLIRLFLDSTASNAAISSGVLFLKIVTPFYFIISVKLIADGILRGAGLMKQFMAATFTDLVLRVVLAVVLAGEFGYAGIWSSWPIGWGIATVLSVWFYRRGPWRGSDAAGT